MSEIEPTPGSAPEPVGMPGAASTPATLPANAGLGRRFAALAIPNILSNLTVPLAGLVDVAFLGHLKEVRFLAGAALGTVLFDYVYWTFGFLRMGMTGMTAQAEGAGRRDEMLAVGLRGMSLGLAAGLALLVLRGPIGDLAFAIMSGAPEVEAAARTYYDTRILAAPAALVNLALLGWYLGRGRAGRALVMTAVANGVNVGLDWFLIVRLGWQVRGAGLASAGGQVAMLIVALAMLPGVASPRAFARARPRLSDRHAWGALFALNRDILVRTFTLVTAFALFTNVSSILGTVVLAANAIVQKVLNLAAYMIDGFAFAAETLAGNFRGAGDRRGLARTIRLTVVSSETAAVGFLLVFTLLPGTLYGLLTDQTEVLAAVLRTAGWLWPVLLLGAGAYALDGVFLGLTEGRRLRNAMLISLGAFLPVAWGAWKLGSNPLLWTALAVFMAARVATLGRHVPGLLRQTAGANLPGR
jgi:MATE family multidrug resistance protein